MRSSVASSRSTFGVWLWSVMSALLVLVLSGCGNDDDLSPATATPAIDPTAPSASTPAAASPEAATSAASPVAGGVGGIVAVSCGFSDGTAGSRPRSPSAQPGPGLVTADAFRVRAGPGNDCPVVTSLRFGATVDLKEELVGNDGHVWRRVMTTRGPGFMHAETVESLPRTPTTSVPVIEYHHIEDAPGDKYAVSPDQLAAQLGWLQKNGYVTITPHDLYLAMSKGQPLPAKPIMLTIDDGHASTTTFKEILDRYGFRGTYFIPNDLKITDAFVKELAASGEVCGHTVTHANLSELSAEEQRAEIVDNKAWLEKLIGKPVKCFAYPYGAYDDATEGILAEAGFRIAFNAWGGTTSLEAVDRWHVERIQIFGGFTLDDFVTAVEGDGYIAS